MTYYVSNAGVLIGVLIGSTKLAPYMCGYKAYRLQIKCTFVDTSARFGLA